MLLEAASCEYGAGPFNCIYIQWAGKLVGETARLAGRRGCASLAPTVERSGWPCSPNSRISATVLFMSFRFAAIALVSMLAVCPAVHAEEPLRLEKLNRCGDLLEVRQQDWCLSVRGLAAQTPTLSLAGKALAVGSVQRDGDILRIRFDSKDYQSGPLLLTDGQRVSNAAWLTLRNSHVLAAGPNEVARNMDGLTTYVDLVSVLIEEDHDGRHEAERLAARYGAKVVGSTSASALRPA